MAQEDKTTIEECNNACRKCMEDFAKDGIDFTPSMCKCCPTGRKLHEALCRNSEAEKKWGNIDWNSSVYGSFYKG